MHLTGSNVDLSFTDKRKAMSASAEPATHIRARRATAFTANAIGTTTTLVGANSAPGTNDANTVRRGDKFVLYNTGGTLKQETVFTVTGIAVAGSTTVTFSPAASGATASGDVARYLGFDSYIDEQNLDSRLLALGATQSQVNQMNQNDKIFAIRTLDDPESI